MGSKEIMKPKATFTKKDALVILGCGVFLLANLGAIGGGARRRAKEMVCLSNLRQWGVVFQMYLADNEGKFSGGEEGPDGFVEHIWVLYLKPYFENYDVMLCPTTTKTWCDGFFYGSFVAWDFRCQDFPGGYDYYGGSYGSYGKNSWCSQWEHGLDPTDGGYNWKTIDSVTGRHRVPLLLGCIFVGGFPTAEDYPPEYEGQTFWSGGGPGEMDRYCINRHQGYINGLFLDWSARKIGLKELWKLKWHRTFDIEGPWTLAGFGGNEDACAAAWDERSPWMKDFPEY
jgi:prepilin-type processing-associated H-X9-DG protein